MSSADPAIDGLRDHEPDYPDHVIETMAHVLLPALWTYYDSPEGQAAFEEWKRQQKDI